MSPRGFPRGGASHRGRVLAVGLLFDAAQLDAREKVARIAPLLRPGDALLCARHMLFLRFSRERTLRAELAPAAVIGAQHGLLASFPLTSEEAAHLSTPDGALLWLEAGAVQQVAAAELQPCAPAQWLDLGELAWIEAESLAAPPLPIEAPELPAPPDMRRALGVPPLAEEAVRVREAVQQRAARANLGRALLQRISAWLAHRSRAGGAGGGRDLQKTRGAAGASLLDRLLSFGLELLAGLGMLWVWRLPHERYLRRLSALFERGDMLEALRNALPLGSGDAQDGPQRLALTPPRRRDELSLRMGAAGPARVLPIGDGWMQHLRALYERAFQQLDRAGEIEHAAFVLAELLADVPRAIQYLERHGRARLAAELADARGAPVGERVRLWFLAGELRRAVDLAVRHGAFADAVTRLEQRDPPQAAALRMLWADRTVSSGRYLDAARIAWNVPEADRLVARWLEIACFDDGPSALAAWIARLSRDAAVAQAAQAALAPAITGRDEPAAFQRELLAREILQHPAAPAIDALVAPLLRGLLRDQVAQPSKLEATVFDGLLARAPVLREDFPRPQRRAATKPGALRVRRTHVPAHQRGTLVAEDAVVLPGGRTLLALGELGMLLLSRAGKRAASWQREPVQMLVPAHDGARVITLSHQSKFARLGRLDLALRRHERWFDLELITHAQHFDGECWYVADGKGVSCLDALDATPRAFWQVATEQPVLEIQVTESSCDFLTLASVDGGREHWSYQLPAATLRARVVLPDAETGAARLTGRGHCLIWPEQLGNALQIWSRGNLGRSRNLPATFERGGAFLQWSVSWPWACIIQRVAGGVRADVLELESNLHLDSLQLDGATRARARFTPGWLVIADDCGRVWRLDLKSHDHFLSCL